MSGKGFRIEPVQQEDVPALAEMAESAFEDDRHTNMKNLAKEPFDMKSYTLSSMPTLLKRPICVVIKAVDEETGDIMGVCNWGFRGVKAADMPKVQGRIQPPDEPPKEPAPEPTPEEIEAEEKAAAAETDPVKRLERLTNKDMEDFMKKTMPPGTRCMFIIGLTVDPKYQGRGVGSALLKWGTNVCDDKGLFAWVHSSAGAWKMYEKCGFEIVQTLKINLDEYAPCKPPNEGPDAKWGEYVFRYMKYFGKTRS